MEYKSNEEQGARQQAERPASSDQNENSPTVPTNTDEGKSPLECARRYRARDLVITPIRRGEKAPFLPGWKTNVLTEEEVEQYFGRDQSNIGVLNGEINRHLVDIDVDAPEAVFAARRFLPPTPCVFGRASKPASHWLYTAPGLDTTKFEDFAGAKRTLIEIRSDDSQTVWPGSTHPSDEAVEFEHFGEPAAIEAAELKAAVGQVAACALISRHWPHGARHDAALAYAGFLARNGCEEDTALALITTAAQCTGDLEGQDRERVVTDTYRKHAAGERVTGLPTLGEILDKETAHRIGERLKRWLDLTDARATGIEAGADGENLTDLGNAARLVARHGERLKYVDMENDWKIYDGQRWRTDTTREVYRLAHETLEGVTQYAATLADKHQRDPLLKHAMKSESNYGIAAMVSQARNLVPGTLDEFDVDPFLFNCANGTINLRTGALQPHRIENKCSMMSPAEFMPGATHPVWEKFLNDSMGGDQELIGFLQRAVGYSLTGDTREKRLFFVYGPTNSGKSTFLEAVKGVIGPYTRTAGFSTFVEQLTEKTREDIARLHGGRFVSATESREGQSLDGEVVKSITGGDTIAARFLYKGTFEFKPQFKLWLASNHRPRVSADDGAMWSRILVVPFEFTVPEKQKDPGIKECLVDIHEAGPAILAWAVAGCLAWQRGGLQPPSKVAKATEEYKNEMDVMSCFLKEWCEEAAGYEVEARALLAAAKTYYRDQDYDLRPPTPQLLGHRLKAMGFERVRVTNSDRWAWRGLRLLEESPRVSGLRRAA
jgi:putative DNA primase/helicase